MKHAISFDPKEILDEIAWKKSRAIDSMFTTALLKNHPLVGQVILYAPPRPAKLMAKFIKLELLATPCDSSGKWHYRLFSTRGMIGELNEET